MAASLPVAEACDVHVATETPAKIAIESTFAIFMFLSFGLVSSLAWETRRYLIPMDVSPLCVSAALCHVITDM
jgi:hypothetical protein